MSSIYRIFAVYKCTNQITGKCYIGFDSKWPNRQKSHKRDYMNPKKSTKFYNALKKYGWNNFVWEIVYQAKELCENPKKSHTLSVMEPFFISEYDSVKNGYNTSLGGDCGPICKGSSNGMWNKTHTDEVKHKLSQYASKKFKNKSYVELYGEERAKQLKRIRSEKSKNKNNSFKNNPRFDDMLYYFHNVLTGEIVHCTRYTFYTVYKINKGGVSEIVNKFITYKNWCILL